MSCGNGFQLISVTLFQLLISNYPFFVILNKFPFSVGTESVRKACRDQQKPNSVLQVPCRRVCLQGQQFNPCAR